MLAAWRSLQVQRSLSEPRSNAQTIVLDAFFAQAVSSSSASLNKTLDPLTSSGSATVSLSASLNKTLDPLTSSGSITVVLSATLSKTLEDVTSSGAASLAITGSTSKTLDPLTSSGSATVSLSASLNKTLDPLTSSGSITVEAKASLNKTLDPLTLVASVHVGSALPGTGMSVGTLTVTDAGVVTGDGLSRELYDALVSQYSSTWPDPNTVPVDVQIASATWSALVSQGIVSEKKRIARRSRAYAQAIISHIQSNAEADLQSGAIL